MDQYKKILIGTNMFCESWKFVSNKINQENIIIQDFNNSNAIYNIIFNKKINFILPLSNKDYNIIKNYNLSSYDIKILYPSKETIELLHNKNLFTKFMLKNYFQYIPEIYYLEDIKLKDIEYPAIYKPKYSKSGIGVFIIHNEDYFLTIKDYNNIQKFIEDEYEYAAFMLCIDGFIINWKIIRFKYKKYNIKCTNFPKNYENIVDFDINIFENIIYKLNYSGGVCIDFKFNDLNNKLNIFEINPRFGGSAFECNFIYDLLCIKYYSFKIIKYYFKIITFFICVFIFKFISKFI